MELLLILIYVSICYVIFKLFRIPVNQWSLATATLGGIVGIALILLVMNYNHPFHKKRAHLLRSDPNSAIGERTCGRGAGAAEYPAQGG